MPLMFGLSSVLPGRPENCSWTFKRRIGEEYKKLSKIVKNSFRDNCGGIDEAGEVIQPKVRCRLGTGAHEAGNNQAMPKLCRGGSAKLCYCG